MTAILTVVTALFLYQHMQALGRHIQVEVKHVLFCSIGRMTSFFFRRDIWNAKRMSQIEPILAVFNLRSDSAGG